MDRVYETVSYALRDAHTSLRRIEILSEAHSLPDGHIVEVDEHNIFVPKKTLVQAFLAARNIFFSISSSSKEKYDASSILLLLNPEHTTAANFRKGYASALPREQKPMTLEADLCFVESMFNSPLNRNTKSPTLWAHRKWLLKTLSASKSAKTPSAVAFKGDMKVVLKASETHPRNLYAWQHLRWALEWRDFTSVDDIDCAMAYAKLTDDMRLWCSGHPSDTSGWSFLLWLLQVHPARTTAAQSNIYHHVLELVRKLRLRNESLWCFLRSLRETCLLSSACDGDELTDAAITVFGAAPDGDNPNIMDSVQRWLEVKSADVGRPTMLSSRKEMFR